tara:strand:- start:629 stop:3127 length:2499 start_codon:yes stop_codon:yes gene_type:complete
MNGLNNSSLFPYSLNNLQQISTSDGGTLPVSADVPLIKTLTPTAQEISLYESSPNVIDFEFYNKSLNVVSLDASTSIYSNSSANFPNANISCFAVSPSSFVFSPFYTGARAELEIVRANTGSINSLTGEQLFFNSGTFNNIIANDISINTLNIPNLGFGVATGSIINANTASFNSLRFTGATGGNIFVNDITATTNMTSNGSANFPIANVGCFAVSPTSFVFSPYYTGSRAELGSVRANTGSFNILSSTGVNTSNLVFSTATGTNLTSNNFVFNTSTGTNLSSTNISYSIATGGTLKSSVVIRNPQTLQFNKIDDTQILRIEPAGASNVLSYYDANNILQETYTTSSSGANIDFINQLGTKDITNLGRIYNGDATQALPSYTYSNDTNTGFYRIGEDNIALSLGNRRNMNFTQTAITMGSGAGNGVDLSINGDLTIARTSNDATSLINFGSSGSIFGVNNTRTGFITNNGTTFTIQNSQATTGSTSIGQISMISGNDSNLRLLKQPNGIVSNISRNTGYGHQFFNLETGGLGLLTALSNKPEGTYVLATQGAGFNSAHTFHASLGSQISNMTLGRTNFSLSNFEYITCRPWTPTGSLSAGIKIANQFLETNGFTMFGMFATGATSGKPLSNYGYILNSNPTAGLAFFTNDNNVIPSTYPRYEINADGDHIFSISSITGAFSITSAPYSVGIGISFSSTRGQGRYVPLAVASLTNTSYTGGTEYLVRGSSSSNNDHSAFTTNQFSADWKGVYHILYNLNLNTSIGDDTVYVKIKVGSTTRQVSNYRISTLASNASNSLYFNCTQGQLIELYIQGDTRTVSMNNDSTFTITYVG